MDPGKRGEYAQLFAVVFFGLLLKLFAGRNFLTENGVLFGSSLFHVGKLNSSFPVLR
jgi:hypothetical protein